jgi:hypothetical protein
MSHQPSAPSAIPVPPACAPRPGEIVPSASNRQSSSIRIELLSSQIQPFCGKRLDDSVPLDRARGQHRPQIGEVTPSNRLTVFVSQRSPSRRAGGQHEFQQAPAQDPMAACVDGGFPAAVQY